MHGAAGTKNGSPLATDDASLARGSVNRFRERGPGSRQRFRRTGSHDRISRGSQANVVATDLSEGMLAVARETCGGFDNIEFRQADAHNLPFADNRLDVVTCRLGVMYFLDCQRALKEILRVLKPGGRAPFVAWGPVEESDFAQIVISLFAKRKASAILLPEAQHPFRFAESGSLSQD